MGGPTPDVGRGDHEGSEKLTVVKADAVDNVVSTAQLSVVPFFRLRPSRQETGTWIIRIAGETDRSQNWRTAPP